MAYKLCLKIIFPSKKVFVEKVLATYVNAKDFGHICTTCIAHKFVCHMCFRFMDVCRGAWCVCCGCQFHVQQLVKPKNLVVGLFDVTTIIMATMIPKFWALLHKFSLTKKIIMYVKDKGSNFQPYAITMNFVVSIKVWACWSLFMGLCFGHAISKVFYNVIIEEKISWGRNLCICKGCKN